MGDMTLLRTPLFDSAIKIGGRMVPFSGWEMAVQFEGLMAEHNAVRKHCGMFDISHMGVLRLVGEDVKEKLQYLVPTNLNKISLGKACYSVLLNDNGGIIDDLIIYDAGKYEAYVVINACCLQSDTEWIRSQLEPQGIQVIDYKSDGTFLAVQGPRAVEILESLGDLSLKDIPRFGHVHISLFGKSVFAARTGYTGEDGFELLIPSPEGPKLWDTLLEKGVVPCGLGARDTLRLEYAMHLYGNEMDSNTTPIEASLSWIVNFDHDYIGRDKLKKQVDEGVSKKLVAIKLTKRNIARHGYPVIYNGETVGQVTSGSWSPTLNEPIALAYVPTELSKIGTVIGVEIRGKVETATVVKKPFIKK